jgi:hypothetical protein
MSKNFVGSLILLLFIFIFALPARAWDGTGHKIVAYIAWQQMSPAAREKVIKILLAAPEDSALSMFYPQDSRSTAAKQLELFMIAAYWSDIIRDQKFKERVKYHHSNWHYSDTFWKLENASVKMIENPNEDGGKALENLFDFEKVLKGAGADYEKAIAIAWIEHLVGDIHQPLHNSARVTELEPKGDQGGNFFLLTPKDTPRDKQENLHSFWDRIITSTVPRQNDAPDMIYLPPIAERIRKKFPFAKMQSRLELGKFDKWHEESFSIATTEVFPATLIRFQPASAAYKKRAFAISEERIALAGYRLGATLDQIFGQ